MKKFFRVGCFCVVGRGWKLSQVAPIFTTNNTSLNVVEPPILMKGKFFPISKEKLFFCTN